MCVCVCVRACRGKERYVSKCCIWIVFQVSMYSSEAFWTCSLFPSALCLLPPLPSSHHFLLLLQSRTLSFGKSFPCTWPALQPAGECPLLLPLVFIQCRSWNKASRQFSFLLPHYSLLNYHRCLLKDLNTQQNASGQPDTAWQTYTAWGTTGIASGSATRDCDCLRERDHFPQPHWTKSAFRSLGESSAKSRLWSFCLQGVTRCLEVSKSISQALTKNQRLRTIK